MIRLITSRCSVVVIMLKGRVHDWVVCVNDVLKLKPTVQNKSVNVEEDTKLRNEDVNVDWHHKWKNQQRK